MIPTHTTAELEYEIQRLSKWLPAMIEETEKTGDSTSLLRCAEFLTRARAALAPVQGQVLIDSREQLPYALPGTKEAIKTGDYTIRGKEEIFSIERKSLPDMVACCCEPGRDRFGRELERAKAFRRFWLVIEGSFGDIIGHNYRSKIHPNSVIGSLLAWSVRVPGLKVILAGNRQNGELIAGRILAREEAEG